MIRRSTDLTWGRQGVSTDEFDWTWAHGSLNSHGIHVVVRQGTPEMVGQDNRDINKIQAEVRPRIRKRSLVVIFLSRSPVPWQA
jgi:hypothetical protein